VKASSLQQTGVELALEILEAAKRQSVLALSIRMQTLKISGRTWSSLPR
jgi:hypothetical protein